MQKLIFYFIALFVLFFACTQNQTEDKNPTSNVTINAASNTTVNNEKITDASENIPTPTPIPPPQTPKTNNLKPVPQADKKDLVYPKKYKVAGVTKFKGAKVDNNIMLENNQGKYGQRIKLSCAANYDEVLAFYKVDLLKNGWEHNARMDKSHKDEDVTFFATNYTKDNYTLMVAVTELGIEETSVMQILKEN